MLQSARSALIKCLKAINIPIDDPSMPSVSQSKPTPESRPWFRGFFHDMHGRKSQSKSNENVQQEDGSSDAYRPASGQVSKRKGGDIAAIFVHAGAGFHSIQNEQIHLKACEE